MRPNPACKQTAVRSPWLHVLLGCALGSAALAGCGAPSGPAGDGGPQGAHNLWLANEHRTLAVEGAVLRERTLYAHHFEDGTTALNQLGMRDLGLLAGRYREQPGALPGALNVRRGGADEALYQGRLEEVRRQLGRLGIEAALVDLVDGLPGGDGASADRAVRALEAPTAGPGSSGEGGVGAFGEHSGLGGGSGLGATSGSADMSFGGQR